MVNNHPNTERPELISKAVEVYEYMESLEVQVGSLKHDLQCCMYYYFQTLYGDIDKLPVMEAIESGALTYQTGRFTPPTYYPFSCCGDMVMSLNHFTELYNKWKSAKQ